MTVRPSINKEYLEDITTLAEDGSTDMGEEYYRGDSEERLK